jgi:pimeloyl-ACP methyl ester carboxylesterase
MLDLTPACGDTLRRGIPDSPWAVLANGGHFPFYEEPERYLQTLATFLTSVEEDG